MACGISLFRCIFMSNLVKKPDNETEIIEAAENIVRSFGQIVWSIIYLVFGVKRKRR